MIRFINVIEVSPLKYPKEDFDISEISDHQSPEDWFQAWIKSQTLLNLDLDSVEKGSCFIDTETIDDENLQIILIELLEQADMEGPENIMVPFNGGIVLMKDEKILIKPTCCGDLRDISEWEKIFKNPSDEWKILEIGHPWIFYKKENEEILFSDYTEVSLDNSIDIKPVLRISETELKYGFERVRSHPIHFKNKILNILTRMNIKDAEGISEIISGLK
ncbi:hypothetical protein QE422_003702 [Chryseobacterium sp. SORGH_AS 447]|uniref:hypothetical protein n=1 Tax=Chryseobacterium sp. SORGH_AS_0447 TaxID=3041769 RepID=UPI00278B8A50|nr:hypothetical protein [Chryseobacterium sp. SORGH_AS_0447]MDQ1163334.1 hypothetical protein [Chryseobacterium sp. SORGH_AS_0447]